jgi:hypothetical protein
MKLLDKLEEFHIAERILNEDKRTKVRYEAELKLHKMEKITATLVAVLTLTLITFILL